MGTTTTTMARSPAAIAGAVCTFLIIGCGFPGIYVQTIEVDSSDTSGYAGLGLWGSYECRKENGNEIKNEYNSFDCDQLSSLENICITQRALYVLAVILSFLAFLASAGGIANKTANFGAACMNFTAAVFCVAAGGYIRNQFGALSDTAFSYSLPTGSVSGVANYSFTD